MWARLSGIWLRWFDALLLSLFDQHKCAKFLDRECDRLSSGSPPRKTGLIATSDLYRPKRWLPFDFDYLGWAGLFHGASRWRAL